MVKRLVEKGFVIKKQSPSSEAEICLELTELGQKAYEGHNDYHRNKGKQWKEIVDQMSEDNFKALMQFIESIEKMLDIEEGKGEK